MSNDIAFDHTKANWMKPSRKHGSFMPQQEPIKIGIWPQVLYENIVEICQENIGIDELRRI